MSLLTSDELAQRLLLADQLLAGGERMLEPQDLPGRYGRVVRAIDNVLEPMKCAALLAGGWAVWRHGYVGRVTQDIDVVLAADRVAEFLKVALVSGFEVLPARAGIWPKLRHKETSIDVDIFPEGATPGTATRPAPTTIPSPLVMGGQPGALRYLPLPYLVELKLAAGRARDESDIVELLRANPESVDAIRAHVANVHADYAALLDRLWQRAQEES